MLTMGICKPNKVPTYRGLSLSDLHENKLLPTALYAQYPEQQSNPITTFSLNEHSLDTAHKARYVGVYVWNFQRQAASRRCCRAIVLSL